MFRSKEIKCRGISKIPCGRGCQPWGHQHTILPNFPKNGIKLTKFGAVGGARGTPLDPLLKCVSKSKSLDLL